MRRLAAAALLAAAAAAPAAVGSGPADTHTLTVDVHDITGEAAEGIDVTIRLSMPDRTTGEPRRFVSTDQAAATTDDDGEAEFELIPTSQMRAGSRYIAWWLSAGDGYSFSMPDRDARLSDLDLDSPLSGSRTDLRYRDLRDTPAGYGSAGQIACSQGTMVAWCDPESAGTADDHVARAAAAAAQTRADDAYTLADSKVSSVTQATDSPIAVGTDARNPSLGLIPNAHMAAVLEGVLVAGDNITITRANSQQDLRIAASTGSATAPAAWAASGNTDVIPYGKIASGAPELGDVVRAVQIGGSWELQFGAEVAILHHGTSTGRPTGSATQAIGAIWWQVPSSTSDPITVWYRTAADGDDDDWTSIATISRTGGGGGGDDAATWAEQGNTDVIPCGKLGPSCHQSDFLVASTGGAAAWSNPASAALLIRNSGTVWQQRQLGSSVANNRVLVAGPTDTNPAAWTVASTVVDPHVQAWAQVGGSGHPPSGTVGDNWAHNHFLVGGNAATASAQWIAAAAAQTLLQEPAQDLVAAMFSDVSAVTYDDDSGKLAITFPGTSGDTTTELFKWIRPGSQPSKIILQAIGDVDPTGEFSERATLVPQYVREGGGYTISVADAEDFSSYFSDDLRLGGTGTIDYDTLTDKPIIRVSTESALPAASSATNGRRYQTNNGAVWRVEDIYVAGDDRVVSTALFPVSVATTGTRYVGGVDHISDIQITQCLAAADEGKWWFVRSTVNRGESPFILCNDNTDFQSIAHSPDSLHAYVGAYNSEDGAEQSHEVTAAGQLVVYPDSSGDYQVYEIQTGFVAGTPGHHEYGYVRQDVTSLLLARLARLEAAAAAAAETVLYSGDVTAAAERWTRVGSGTIPDAATELQFALGCPRSTISPRMCSADLHHTPLMLLRSMRTERGTNDPTQGGAVARSQLPAIVRDFVGSHDSTTTGITARDVYLALGDDGELWVAFRSSDQDAYDSRWTYR